MVADDAVENAVGLRLLVHVLDDRLDDEIAIVQVVEPRRACEIPERPVPLLGGDLALLDAPGEELLDPAHPLLEESVLDLANDRLVARRRADLRDSRPHQAAAQHADCSYRHISPGL